MLFEDPGEAGGALAGAPGQAVHGVGDGGFVPDQVALVEGVGDDQGAAFPDLGDGFDGRLEDVVEEACVHPAHDHRAVGNLRFGQQVDVLPVAQEQPDAGGRAVSGELLGAVLQLPHTDADDVHVPGLGETLDEVAGERNPQPRPRSRMWSTRGRPGPVRPAIRS
ncbi:hypothetical protein [Streptomyces sp. NPDC001985]|uniref:hypothetical protein n=1 Tax=Streptomyces sp. NPDC001985 TaxID=3154406 RepID=UPI003321F6F5